MVSTSPYIPSAAAAATLLACLQAMGERNSNAVLELLGHPPVIRQNQRYPEDKLCFGMDKLRAYYHSHAEPWPRQGEHGHFHFFLPLDGNDGQRQWAHLAALSIDDEGQPQHWSMVNHWVTGGAWLQPQDLPETLSRALTQTPDTLLEQWLLAMLGVYTAVFEPLLEARDRAMQAAAKGRELDEIRQDRAIYTLATEDIALATDLQSVLATPTKGITSNPKKLAQ